MSGTIGEKRSHRDIGNRTIFVLCVHEWRRLPYLSVHVSTKCKRYIFKVLVECPFGSGGRAKCVVDNENLNRVSRLVFPICPMV